MQRFRILGRYGRNLLLDQLARQIVGIEALGTAAKLRSLQLLDDRSETLYLAVATLERANNIADQANAEGVYLSGDF